MNTKNANILIIDDDKELCELLDTYLSGEGFTVSSVYDGISGLKAVLEGNYALIILDVMLPGMEGFTLLKEIRKEKNVPVFMLTARGEDADKIAGIETGADDYLSKPYNPRELLVRIKAILRRSSVPVKGEILHSGSLTINTTTLNASAEGRDLALTSAEFHILEILMRSTGKAVSRDEISKLVFDRELNIFDRSIDVHISNIRKKIGSADIIKSIRGSGYILTAEVKS